MRKAFILCCLILFAGCVPLKPSPEQRPITGPAADMQKAVSFEKDKKYSEAISIYQKITTDSPQWGGLSGCTFEEAMSWGKEDPKGRHVQVYCDATIALPIVTQALFERNKMKRAAPDFSWIFDKKD